jgi:hypothetical protein
MKKIIALKPISKYTFRPIGSVNQTKFDSVSIFDRPIVVRPVVARRASVTKRVTLKRLC